jgi:hypothetical protein
MSDTDEGEESIRSPNSDRLLLTISAARRLIRTMLRQHVIKLHDKWDASREDYDARDQDVLLDYEKAVQASADAAWRQTLLLWGDWKNDAETRAVIASCIMQGLTEAVRMSAHFVFEQRMGPYGEDIFGSEKWVPQFIEGFSPNLLLEI